MNYRDCVKTLTARRKELGWTQQQLDAMLYGGGSTVVKYETFERRPTFPKFVDWCDALGMDIRLAPRRKASELKIWVE